MKKTPAKGLFKNILFIILVFISLGAVFTLFNQPSEEIEEISVTKLVEDINQEKINKITVSGTEITIGYKDESQALARKEENSTIDEVLLNFGVSQEKLKNVDFDFKQPEDNSWISTFIFFVVLPLLIFAVFFFMVFRQAKSGAMQTFDFIKSKARIFGADGHPKEKINFKDVAGAKEAKHELEEVVDFLKNPHKYLRMGAKIPRGVLLVGPAGCGKTLLARATAGESNVPFFSVSGSSFVEMFVGVGSGRVRSLFENAKKAQPCLIFIDELDSIGKVRGPAVGGGNEEREQTLNQLLTEMDGFNSSDKVIVIAATNRPDVLDPAILRPGRFDRKVVLDWPDVKEREAILKIHSHGKPLALNVNLREVAERTPGFCGADLANIMNEAAIHAAQKNKNQIFQNDILEAIDKVLLGPERKSHILTEEEKRVAAYHEAGHALVGALGDGKEPVRKISIIARGMAAGYTLKVPRQERRLKTKTEFLGEIATLLGGYCAEKLIFGEVTTGASDDLKRASAMARKLVKDYGMSSLGPIVFGEKETSQFLGQEYGEYKNYSEKVAMAIDKEVEKFVKSAQEKADRLLGKNKAILKKVSETLIEKETIEREEFEELLKTKKKVVRKRAAKRV